MKPSCALLILAVMLAASGSSCRASRAAPAAKCDPRALRPCAPVILLGTAPSTACCVKLRELKPCLCKYAKNRDLGKYINSRDSRKVAAACGLRVPIC
ncbi:non-specific lipid-transfer protein 2 [Brachypodium distachyon]|uniref:Bifunctional inhibitor/plant lipid transfer protein/seed storage helical domain-containing protein n=1 Tax=Brachypodium distachyon TaxID=15368 RepID=A0A0Q3KE57_BRADI|nr:non-specific lipid-transfer protein 2 [Brachypodium distachyon]KQK09265.1 hypothetical protein BRADI_2g47072v3 [Brachypodium distachyon]|eukprot:XP_010232168.1 non-specific lipid-transfer protein 2 [Brachypodium distachyon]